MRLGRLHLRMAALVTVLLATPAWAEEEKEEEEVSKDGQAAQEEDRGDPGS